jgi:RNA polymerase sigma-70 factor, ECF subfamily
VIVVNSYLEIEKWFVEYSDDVYNFLVYYTGSHEVEDLVQDVFIKAIKGFSSFKGMSAPKTWLFTIARNTAIDYHRKKHKTTSLTYEALIESPAEENTPYEKVQLDEEFRNLYFAMNKLKQSYRDVLLLRGIKELSPSEAAEILNWSESKVNVTLHRAIKSLKKQLSIDDKEVI